MQYEILTLEEKKPGWKIATLRGLDGTTTEAVSISETNQKGDVQFLDFKNFIVGAKIEGNLWKKPDTGRMSIFPPKPTTGGFTGSRTPSGAVKAAEITSQSVDKSMEKKGLGIMVSAAMRDATQITLASLAQQQFPTDAEFQVEFEKWRSWYLKKWKETNDIADQAF